MPILLIQSNALALQATGGRYYVNNCCANFLLTYLHDFSKGQAYTGGPGYAIPSHIKSILDQLKALAEDLGVKDALAEGPAAGTAPEDSTDPQGRTKKSQKQLPTQLNPLLAKLARHAATENDKVPGKGGHPVIFLALPWTHTAVAYSVAYGLGTASPHCCSPVSFET